MGVDLTLFSTAVIRRFLLRTIEEFKPRPFITCPSLLASTGNKSYSAYRYIRTGQTVPKSPVFFKPAPVTNMQIAIVFLAVVACAIAAPAQPYDYKPSYPSYSGYKDNYDYAPAYYDFGYAVKDDYSYVDFGHNENRNGDKTNGQYNVVLPDGRRQVVNYYVDGYSGYIADVKYEGGYKPTYTDYKPTYSADYKPDYKPAYKPAVYPQTEYKPAYKPAYKPSYPSSYAPSYKPAY